MKNVTKPKRNRLSNETLNLLQKKKELKVNKNEHSEYTSFCKLLRKMIRDDYDNYRKERERETVKTKCSLKRLDKELNMKQSIPNALLNNNNDLEYNRKEMERIVKDFYEDLYESKLVIPAPNLTSQIEIPEVLQSEIEHAAKQLQSGKAAGLDHIKIEDIKNGGSVLHKALAQRITWYIRESKIPKPWKTSKTILLFKKGVKEDIKNFRPICLLSHVYKLMTRVILNRIRNTLEENIGKENKLDSGEVFLQLTISTQLIN